MICSHLVVLVVAAVLVAIAVKYYRTMRKVEPAEFVEVEYDEFEEFVNAYGGELHTSSVGKKDRDAVAHVLSNSKGLAVALKVRWPNRCYYYIDSSLRSNL